MALRFYLDASALTKRYAAEIGTAVINHLFTRVARTSMACLHLNALEVISIFVRKKNTGRLPVTAFNQAMTDFRSEIWDSTAITKWTATDALLGAAVVLVVKYSINATDGILLRSALDSADEGRPVGDDVILVTSDQRLIRAAHAEGLLTFNPETQTQTDLDALLGP